MALVPASDGYVAREVQPWNDEKLYYVDRYFDIFTTSMKDKWSSLGYADLLCGPGLCRDRSGIESRGSPLLALTHEPFGRLFFNDADPRVIDALRARIERDGLAGDRPAEMTAEDCNDIADRARDFLFPAGQTRRTLGLAFVDNQGFEMSLDGLARLTRDVRLDLIITFMTSYARRFARTGQLELDQFLGTESGRDLEKRRTFTADLLELYRRQLAGIGYEHFDYDTRILNTKRSRIYHLIFVSKHELGAGFFRKISAKEYSGQRRMGL